MKVKVGDTFGHLSGKLNINDVIKKDPAIPEYFRRADVAESDILETGYNSTGRTRPFLGPVDLIPDFCEAMEARSYRNELILVAADLAHSVLLFNLLLNVEHLGYHHHVVYSHNQDECAAMAMYWPGLGCVWLESLGLQQVPTKFWNAA